MWQQAGPGRRVSVPTQDPQHGSSHVSSSAVLCTSTEYIQARRTSGRAAREPYAVGGRLCHRLQNPFREAVHPFSRSLSSGRSSMLGSAPSLAPTMNMAIVYPGGALTPSKPLPGVHATARACSRPCRRKIWQLPLLRVSVYPRPWQCTFPLLLFLFEEEP
jgi:hypothetical protein